MNYNEYSIHLQDTSFHSSVAISSLQHRYQGLVLAPVNPDGIIVSGPDPEVVETIFDEFLSLAAESPSAVNNFFLEANKV
jgi:hypothetical protein